MQMAVSSSARSTLLIDQFVQLQFPVLPEMLRTRKGLNFKDGFMIIEFVEIKSLREIPRVAPDRH